MDSLRYRTFINTGIACVSCKLEASFFALERHRGNGHRYHLNLYGIIFGREVLFTKDHIIPRSKGGPNVLINMQTMCQPCNTAKGNKCHASAFKSCLGYRGRIRHLRKKIQKEMTANKRRRKGHYLSGTSDGGPSFMAFKKRYRQLQQRFLRLKVIADARKAMKEKV